MRKLPQILQSQHKQEEPPRSGFITTLRRGYHDGGDGDCGRDGQGVVETAKGTAKETAVETAMEKAEETADSMAVDMAVEKTEETVWIL